MDSFSFLCMGDKCETEESAWASWKKDAEYTFKWINGYKIWRAVPEMYADKSFDEDRIIYQVRARVVALTELPEGFEEAVIDGPYKSNNAEFESINGFGF